MFYHESQTVKAKETEERYHRMKWCCSRCSSTCELKVGLGGCLSWMLFAHSLCHRHGSEDSNLVLNPHVNLEPVLTATVLSLRTTEHAGRQARCKSGFWVTVYACVVDWDWLSWQMYVCIICEDGEFQTSVIICIFQFLRVFTLTELQISSTYRYF